MQSAVCGLQSAVCGLRSAVCKCHTLFGTYNLPLSCIYESLLYFYRSAPFRPIITAPEAPLGVFGIRDIRGKNYWDTGYLRKKLLGYRILRSSFRDTGYSQKIVTYQMFDEKRSWITKYMPFSVFLLMIRYKWKIYKCKTNRLTSHPFIMDTMWG